MIAACRKDSGQMQTKTLQAARTRDGHDYIFSNVTTPRSKNPPSLECAQMHVFVPFVAVTWITEAIYIIDRPNSTKKQDKQKRCVIFKTVRDDVIKPNFANFSACL